MDFLKRLNFKVFEFVKSVGLKVIIVFKGKILGINKKGRLWCNSDVFTGVVDKGSFVLVSFMST